MKNKKQIKAIKFTKEELKWIERTADIECAMAMNKFTQLVNQTNIKDLDNKKKKMVKNISKELIDLYLFLRTLRTKLELWDCRYGVEKGFKIGKELSGGSK